MHFIINDKKNKIKISVHLLILNRITKVISYFKSISFYFYRFIFTLVVYALFNIGKN